VTVREMRSSDAVKGSLLLASSFPQELGRYLPYAQPGTARFLEDELAKAGKDPTKKFLVFEDEDQIAGFAEYRLEGAETALLAHICVAGWARRRGVATALVEQFLASHPSVRRLELDVFEENLAAARLYEGLGFATTGVTSWYRRGLPEPTLPLEIPDAATMEVTHKRYSFSQCEFRVAGETRRVGRIGRTVLRCFDERTFGDDALLSQLRATFSGVREALLIGAPSGRSDLPHGSSEIVRSRRMVWELPFAMGDPT